MTSGRGSCTNAARNSGKASSHAKPLAKSSPRHAMAKVNANASNYVGPRRCAGRGARCRRCGDGLDAARFCPNLRVGYVQLIRRAPRPPEDGCGPSASAAGSDNAKIPIRPTRTVVRRPTPMPTVVTHPATTHPAMTLLVMTLPATTLLVMTPRVMTPRVMTTRGSEHHRPDRQRYAEGRRRDRR